MGGERTEIAPLLKADIDQRVAVGSQTYGSPLAIESENDSLQYAYEEALDLCFYLKQELLRRDEGKGCTPDVVERVGQYTPEAPDFDAEREGWQ